MPISSPEKNKPSTHRICNNSCHVNVFNAMLHAVSESALLIEQDGTIRAANSTAARRLGKTEDSIIGLNVLRLIPAELAQSRLCHINQAVETGETQVFEDFRDGRYFRNTMFPICSKEQNVQLAIFAVDITEAKSLEQEIEHTQGYYKTILDNISDAVFLIDATGAVKSICSNVHPLFGYDNQEFQRHPDVFSLMSPSLPVPLPQNPDGAILNHECAISHKNGESRYALVSCRNTDIISGAYLVTCRDITEKHQVDEALTRKNDALAEILKTLESEKSKTMQALDNSAKKLLFPIINMIAEKPGCDQLAHLLTSTLNYLTSRSGAQAAPPLLTLSPREIEICNMVRSNFSTKDIARMLSLSPQTVQKQRKTIRKKLGISDSSINLSSFLMGTG